MTELINKAAELIQAVGDSYIRLLAFIFFVIVVAVFSLHHKSPKADKMEATRVLIVFGLICVFGVLLVTKLSFSHVPIPSLPQFSLINWIGFGVGGLGLVEFMSSMRVGGDRNVHFNPGLSILIFGITLVLWSPVSANFWGYIWLGIIGRLVGTFGVALLIEGLLYSSYLALRFESSSSLAIGVGIFLLLLGIVLASLGA